MMPAFFAPFALAALLKYWRARQPISRTIFLSMSAACLTLQIWAGVYLGWFFCYGLMCLAGILLVNRDYRQMVRTRLIEDKCIIGILAVVSVICLLPLILHSHAAKDLVGGRIWYDLRTGLPTIGSFFLAHQNSYIYGFLDHNLMGNISRLYNPHEMHLFVGFIAILSPFILYHRIRKQPELLGEHRELARISIKTLALMIALCFTFYRSITLWQAVVFLIPGADVIRVATRVIALLLIPLGIVVGITIEQAKNRYGAWAAGLLLIGVIAENSYRNTWGFDPGSHVQRLNNAAAQLDKESGCGAFLLQSQEPGSNASHIDAMWLSLQSRIPTINGYSGNYPPGWRLQDLKNISESDLQSWTSTTSAEGSNSGKNEGLCRISLDVPAF